MQNIYVSIVQITWETEFVIATGNDVVLRSFINNIISIKSFDE